VRHEKAEKLLDMARLLASSAEGYTLEELGRALGEDRRTVERMRDAVRRLFPQMETLEEGRSRRFRIPGGLDAVFQTPTADELAALHRAAESFKGADGAATAVALASLERKLLAALRSRARNRLAPDVEALVQAEALAMHAGPRPFDDPAVLGAVREAILSSRALAFDYHGGASPGRRREVTPYGVLFGRANYLVAGEGDNPEPRKWRLDRMSEIAVLERVARPPADFDLKAYADESFGIYRDELQDVELLITPDGADDALGWRFHPRQTVTQAEDGTVRVRFRAAGMLELAWHLFTWGDKVRVIAPDSLRETLVTELRKALAAHEEAS
jgi:predicted DNA-binding transcriptional regulator YafY